MKNEEKASKIAKQHKLNYTVRYNGVTYTDSSEAECYNSAMDMAQWKDEQVKQIQEREIKACNDYIEKHPNNKLMLQYHLGRLSLCDELLGTNSKDKINMAFATMD